MKLPEEHFIDVGSIRTRYWAEGSGSPLVLVHGLGGSATGWILNFAALAAQHRVYALDLAGHGRTGTPASGKHELTDMARFVHDFMVELGIEHAHLCGHSLGGAICLQVALHFPGLVDRLVIVDSAGLGREIYPLFRLMSLPLLGELFTALAYRPGVERYAQGLRASVVNFDPYTPEVIQALYDVERRPELGKNTLKALRYGANLRGQQEKVYKPILQGLPDIPNPALLIWGRQDNVIPLAHGENAARSLPNARLEVIENSGHVCILEQPETFNRLVLEFLKD